jgi:two-component system, NarL family, sensor histidine kinase DegS
METTRRDQFSHRAKAVFYARLALDAFGVLFLLVPSWASATTPFLTWALVIYLVLLAGHVTSYLWIDHRGDHVVFFLSLCLDTVALGSVIVLTGGLASPLMSGHILYAVFFAILYPHPLAILPPLLLLPVIAKISQLTGIEKPGRDLLLLLWYSGLDLIIVYVVVYFDLQENLQFRNILQFSSEKQRLGRVAERQRMAREMHDGLGAILSTIKIQSEFVCELAQNDSELKTEAEELQQRTNLALAELRRAVRILRDDFDLTNSLEELIGNLSSIWKFEARLITNLETRQLPVNRQLHLYRIVQEALTNAGKHARARTVTVTVMHDEKPPQWVESGFSGSGIRLEITDDGRGFPVEQQKQGHYGLVHLQERAAEMGGACRISSAPDEGTTICGWFPNEEEA